MSVFIYTLLILFIYFGPSLVASHRKHRNFGSIFVINLTLGWTIIMWIVCLSWAFSANTKSQG